MHRALRERGGAKPLADDAIVIVPLIRVGEPGQDRARTARELARLAAKLIRERQQQHDERLLMRRIGLEDVLADALRPPRLVHEPVPLRFLKRPWNALPPDP